jgi:hypothetical protein
LFNAGLALLGGLAAVPKARHFHAGLTLAGFVLPPCMVIGRRPFGDFAMNRKQRRAHEKAKRLNQKAARKAAATSAEFPGDAMRTSLMSDVCIANARNALHVNEHHGPESDRPLISDERAKQMLANAAESLSLAERILKGCLDAVPTQVLKEAAAEMQAEADPDEDRPQPPPAVRIVITLVRQLTTVTRLLQQVLKLTHPHLFERTQVPKAA